MQSDELIKNISLLRTNVPYQGALTEPQNGFANRQLKYNSYEGLPMRKELPDWNKSAAVLRNSSNKYSFSKDSRFKAPKINSFNHYQLKYPSTLSQRSASIGIGRKAQIPQVFSSHKQEATIGVPFYEVDDMVLRRSQSERIKRGKTFGISCNSYQACRTLHRNTIHSEHQLRKNPGPKYKINQPSGDGARKSTIHARLRMFSDMRSYHKRDEPGPQNYFLNESLIYRSSPKTNFGIGKKSNFTNNPQAANFPGPSFYNNKSFTDKFSRTKLKNLGPK